MAVLLSNQEDLAARHEFSIGEPLTVFTNRRELIFALDESIHEDIVLIGSDIELESAIAVAEHFRLKRPSLSVLLIRKRPDLQTLNEAMRGGIRDVVSVDDAMALVDSVRRAKVLSQQVRLSTGSQQTEAKRGHIVVVFSAKGGCGKTTMSTNLAITLGKLGIKTCLVDFDLQFGDVAVALQVEPTKTISDALSMETSLDRLGVMSLTIPIAENVDAILAPTNPADVELISGDLAENMLVYLQEEYDVIVIDSPPAFTEVMIRAFDLADMTLLLTTLDMPAIKNLVLSIETLDALGLQHKARRIVVNRSDSRAGLEIQDVETAVGLPISAKMESTVDVPASVNRGLALVNWKPSHPFSKSVREMARMVAEDLDLPLPEDKKRSWRRGK